MSFILLYRTSSTTLRPHRCLHHHQTLRFFIEARVKLVRDRGLDHAVEREKHLQPMLALKNLIKSEPTKSIPISVASDNRTQLALPTRAADFIRKYPSIFEEFLPPGGSPARPHVRLTPEVLGLDEEEQLIYQRESYREDVAKRLLKFIMLTRINSIPISIIDMFKWDLGLPPDYARTLVTDFPDYFQITTVKEAPGNGNRSGKSMLALELVCWIDEFAKSATQKKAKGYTTGMPLAFPIQYSRGYEVEKKVKIWLDEWQKLPYISPYEDASHLQSKSDQAEKWTVAVLHELLHLFISKKTERENVFCLSEYLGFGARFKRALVTHPGIFYVSNKIRTKTVVLREAFKRDLLLEKHPLMSMRYQYIHLMNKLVDQVKPTTTTEQKRKPRADEVGMEAEGASADAYDKDSEDEDEDEDEDEVEDEDEHESEDEDDEELESRQTGGRGRRGRNTYGHAETRTTSRTAVQTTSKRSGPNMVGDRVLTPPPRRTDSRKGYNSGGRSPGRTDHSRTRVRLATEKTERTNTRY